MSAAEMRFHVPLDPVPQGSKDPTMRESAAERLIVFRQGVAMLARGARAGTWPTVRAPEVVGVRLAFRIRRPRTGEWAEATEAGFRPDLDKLCRSVLDALAMAGVYANDSQVVKLQAEKWWAFGETVPGVLVEVRRL